ncbi:AMP-binding protein [Bordetella sp. BOR01]|uniref:AMP-binding protein n=1 Tax=Bordetella sp. BOR01 TaxID=2854779 RepID=UPI001C44B73B|nr:AMP-binding protein [Bordetella sp. BOR01]MBV7486408.1 AMP-binding protein [Bordetella sp. BOR01]
MVILGHKEASFLTAILGCLSLEVPYVPVDSHDGVYRIRRIVDIAQASLIYDTAADRFIGGPAGTQPLAEAGLACILFKPDANGEPLGAQIGRESIALLADWLRRHGALGPAPVFMGQMPFTCGFSLLDVAGVLALGGTSVLPGAGTQESASVHQLARQRVTTLSTTASHLNEQLANPHFGSRALPDLNLLILCDEPFSPPLSADLRQRFPSVRIVNMYGCIEVTCTAIWSALDDEANPFPGCYTLGKGPDYTEVFIRDGEICVSGNHVMRGYINAPELNRSRLFHHKGKRAYRTGEPGTIDERGLLHRGSPGQDRSGQQGLHATPD